MTVVASGFASASSSGGGTEFLSMLAPPGDALKDYDNTKSHTEQTSTFPQVFHDAMSVREEVYGEQGIPLEAEFDEDDARSWHWVVYASVGSSSSASPQSLSPTKPGNKEEEERRASATAQRLPVGTIRLVPPPHGPDKYKHKPANHPDSDPPAHIATHPVEPYVKLGRLAILKPYRRLGLSKLLINAVLVYATNNPDTIQPPPSPTTMELANQLGKAVEEAVVWKGLTLVHAQAEVARLWASHGFSEELVNEAGKVEIPKEEHWTEEGIEHLGMWKRLKLDPGRL